MPRSVAIWDTEAGTLYLGRGEYSECEPDPLLRLAGDVDCEGVKEVAGSATPVPGGVGPMTITMLMRNTLRGAQMKARKAERRCVWKALSRRGAESERG
jgi:hypothetical protein